MDRSWAAPELPVAVRNVTCGAEPAVLDRGCFNSPKSTHPVGLRLDLKQEEHVKFFIKHWNKHKVTN